MRLFDAILEANHRASAGDVRAGIHPEQYADELPLAALTCIDPRLNPLFPDALGLPKESFIWLRNAGNIIFGSMSTMMRSLALACAVKGAREIAIIGHTDCLVSETSTAKLNDAFGALGIDRSKLPTDLTDFFGLFASEQANVLKAVGYVRDSPLIGPRIPVHGLIINVETGRLDWVVNGYDLLMSPHSATQPPLATPHVTENPLGGTKSFDAFQIGEMKFPETKIGEVATPVRPPEPALQAPATPGKPPIAPMSAIPYPPRIKGK